VKADEKLLQIVSVQAGLVPLMVAADGAKPTNARFVVVHVSVMPVDTPNDPTAPPGRIRTEDF
jgi:hypothetical protein